MKLQQELSLIHISEPTRLLSISYAVFCLKKKDQIPDIVISSSANRAKTTAELAINTGNWSSNFYIDERIYGRSSDFLLELAKLIDDKHKSICFVGHEPTCSSFISLSTFHSARFKTEVLNLAPVSYTHLTLPTICSV